MHNRGGVILLVLTVFFIHCTWASSLHRSARQATSPVAALGVNGYCGGYNDVDCSAVCYWNRFNYYQCRPDQCYCF